MVSAAQLFAVGQVWRFADRHVDARAVVSEVQAGKPAADDRPYGAVKFVLEGGGGRSLYLARYRPGKVRVSDGGRRVEIYPEWGDRPPFLTLTREDREALP